MEKLTISEYARRKGTSRQAVYKAIRSGKITKGYIEEGAQQFILPDIADSEWRTHHNPVYERTSKSGKPIFEHPENAQSNTPTQGGSVAEIKRAKLVYETKLKQLEFEEKNGTLVNKQKVYETLFGFGKEMRTAFLAVPDRVIDDIISANNRNDAYNILQNEINNVLTQLSDFSTRPITSDR